MQSGGLIALAILALGACLFSAVVALIVVQNKGGDSSDSKPPTADLPGEAYAGLPSAPPTFAVIEEAKKRSDAWSQDLVQTAQGFLNSFFYVRSNCWQANHFFRVTCMDLLKSYMTAYAASAKNKESPKKREALRASLQKKVMEAATDELGRCPPDAFVIDPNNRTVTVRQMLAQGFT